MFVVTVTFVASPEHAEAFRERVRQQASDSLSREAGCHRFDVCADPDTPGRTFLYEVYSDEAAFRAHLETRHFRDFDRDVATWIEDKTVATWTLLD